MREFGLNTTDVLIQWQSGTQKYFSVQQRLIDDVTYEVLELAFHLVLHPLQGVMAICANIINFVVFLNMGVMDGATLSFLVLAVSDGLYAFIVTLSSASYIIRAVAPKEEESMILTATVISWTCALARNYPKCYSLVITVVITVVRCICVTLPFKVKDLLTTERQMAAIFVFSGIATAILTITFSGTRAVYYADPILNTTKFMYKGDNSKIFSYFTNIFFYSGFVIVVVCVVILNMNLRESSKFRELSTGSKGAADSESKVKAKRRELQVVKVVIMVATVLIVSFLPAIAVSIINTVFDVTPPTGRYINFRKAFKMIDEMTVSLT